MEVTFHLYILDAFIFLYCFTLFSMEPTKRERQAKERLERLQRRERRRMEQMNDCTTIVVSDKSDQREI